MKKAWEEFAEGKIVLESLPFKSILELSQNCNFRCVMCSQSWDPKYAKYDPKLNMPFDLFVKLAEEMFPTMIAADLRGFGETTILPYWPDVVSHLDRYPFIDWYLVTNLSHPKAELWEKMISVGFDLGISFDGATAETFEAIRVGSRFKQIRKNLGVLQDAVKRYNRGLVYFISTIQQKNFHEMADIVEIAAEFSVPDVQFKMVRGDLNLYGINDEVILPHVQRAIDVGLERQIRVTFNDRHFTKNADKKKLADVGAFPARKTPNNFQTTPEFDRDLWEQEGMDAIFWNIIDFSGRTSVNQKCFKPFGFTYVNYEGQMGTCNHMMDAHFLSMGDLHLQSMREIWNNESYQDFRRQLITATPKSEACKWCFKNRLED